MSIKNDNITYDDKKNFKDFLNSKSISISVEKEKNEKNLHNNDTFSQKFQIFNLCPIESFLINKILPPSIKMESEEQFKNSKRKRQIYQFPLLKKKKKRKKIHDISLSEDEMIEDGVLNKKAFRMQERRISQEQCELMIDKLKQNKHEKIFHSSNSLTNFLQTISNQKLTAKEPSLFTLKEIYTKVKEQKFNSIYQLGNELRKFFDKLFKRFSTVPPVYNEVWYLNDYFEKEFKELSSQIGNSGVIQSDKIIQQVYYSNSAQVNGNKKTKNIFKTTTYTKRNNMEDETQSLTFEEKEKVAEHINDLNQEQLQFVLQIIKDFIDISTVNQTYVVFDIDKLPRTKQREVQAFMESCLENKPIYPEDIKNISNNEQNEENLVEKVKQLKNDLRGAYESKYSIGNFPNESIDGSGYS